MTLATGIPPIALSVRQPWAWAIIHGGKDIENRSAVAVTKGKMRPKWIAVHASKSMTQREYQQAHDFMASIDVACPDPNQLVRGAIIGTVQVVEVVEKSDSPWFFGPRGLILKSPMPLEPIPSKGALGYFSWSPSGEVESVKPWMMPPTEAITEPLSLFGDDK